jgi:hypothetical protein
MRLVAVRRAGGRGVVVGGTGGGCGRESTGVSMGWTRCSPPALLGMNVCNMDPLHHYSFRVGGKNQKKILFSEYSENMSDHLYECLIVLYV